jgi:dTDP-glucose pyrophosphorylase
MKDLKPYLICENASILEALKRINELPDSLTLLVTREDDKLLGTLTDGDIRRGFIKGLTLSDPISKFMSVSFKYIKKGFSISELKTARHQNIRLLPFLDEDDRIIKIYDLKKCASILPLECVIMAGGRGERLRPLTDNVPKPMLLLGNKPIIVHNIDRLISYGIEKIYISVRYLGQKIVDYFGDGSSKGIRIEYIWEDEPIGTVGAISLVKDFTTDYILIMNSDLFTDVDFEDLYLNVINSDSSLGVSTIPYTTKIPYGIFTVDENQIKGLKEKPIYTNYANAGIYILKKKIIDKIPYNSFFNITDLMEKLIEEGQTVIHNPIVGYWIDIGQLQDYLNAQEIVKHLHNGGYN